MMNLFHDTTFSYSFTNYSKHKPFEKLALLIESIKDRNFKNKVNRPIENKNIQDPLIYTLFGNKDLLIIYQTISLTSITELLIDDGFDNFDNLYYDGHIHNISGFTFRKNISNCINNSNNSKTEIAKFPEGAKSSNLISITQFKLNTAYLFSSGNLFVSSLINQIEKILKNYITTIDYQITYSFSSYELILTLFGNDFLIMSNIIQEIREFKLDKLDFDFIADEFRNHFNSANYNKDNLLLVSKDQISNNLYKGSQIFYNIVEKYTPHLSENSPNEFNFNVFSDSQSSFGLKIKLKKINDNYMVMLPEKIEMENVLLNVEFKIKPAFYNKFKIVYSDLFGDLTPKFLPGKTDFTDFEKKFEYSEYRLLYYMCLLTKSDIENDLINYNHIPEVEVYRKYLIQFDNDNDNCIFSQYVRHIHSKLYFPISEKNEIIGTNQYQNCSNLKMHHIEQLSFDMKIIKDINIILKKLGISNYLRNKFVKMYLSYNEGIGTTVTFNLHLDTFWFLKEAKFAIEDLYNTHNNSELQSIILLQKRIETIIEAYEKSHQVRAIQNFGYENGSEIFMNYNSSTQGFISDVDSMLKLTIKSISKYFPRQNNFIPSTIAILDYLRPESSSYYTNFTASNIFNPGLLFNYTIQESIVVLLRHSSTKDSINIFLESLNKEWSKHVNNSSILKDFIKKYKPLFNDKDSVSRYLIKDWIRFKLFFDDFKEFQFWQIYTAFQLSNVYTINGRINEMQTSLEITRLIFIYLISNEKTNGDSFKEDFLSFNPFDKSVYSDNYTIWKDISFVLYDLIYDFLALNKKIILYSFNNFINANFINENEKNIVDIEEEIYFKIDEISDSLNNFNDTRESLNPLLITIYKAYFREIYKKYDGKIRIKHEESANSKDDFNNYIYKSDDAFTLDPKGSLWFRDYEQVLDFNRISFKYIGLLSHLCYLNKLFSFEYYLYDSTIHP